MVGGAEEGLCGFLKDIIFECCVDSIGIQETMLKTSSHSFLRHLGQFGNFKWHWLALEEDLEEFWEV
jgi:hypothetical protein